MLTVADFRARFPEFLCPNIYPDARILIFLTDALMDINVDKFGDLAERAQLYLAAHYLAVATGTQQGDASNVGKVSSKSVDSVSVSYSGGGESAQADIYESTSYGQIYLGLVKRVCPGMITVGVNSDRVTIPNIAGAL
jgi:Protein of unknown function (DUF4054)